MRIAAPAARRRELFEQYERKGIAARLAFAVSERAQSEL
jgi:hypothetical protein